MSAPLRLFLLWVVLALLLAACGSGGGAEAQPASEDMPIPNSEKTRVAAAGDGQAEDEADQPTKTGAPKPTKTARPKPTKTPIIRKTGQTAEPKATGTRTATITLTPTMTLTPTPKETVAVRNESFKAADGVKVRYTVYVPLEASGPYPLAVIAPMHVETRAAWDKFSRELAKKGFIVAVMELRAPVKTSDGKDDWSPAASDLLMVWERLYQRKEVDRQRTALVGASLGANLALQAAAGERRIAATALLSPGADYRGVTSGQAMRVYGRRPLLILAGEKDTLTGRWPDELRSLAGDLEQVFVAWYPVSAHGTALLETSEARDKLINWLVEQVKKRPQPPPAWLSGLKTWWPVSLGLLGMSLLLIAGRIGWRAWQISQLRERREGEAMKPTMAWDRVGGMISRVSSSLNPNQNDALVGVRVRMQKKAEGTECWVDVEDDYRVTPFLLAEGEQAFWVVASGLKALDFSPQEQPTEAETRSALRLLGLDAKGLLAQEQADLTASGGSRNKSIWQLHCSQKVTVGGALHPSPFFAAYHASREPAGNSPTTAVRSIRPGDTGIHLWAEAADAPYPLGVWDNIPVYALRLVVEEAAPDGGFQVVASASRAVTFIGRDANGQELWINADHADFWLSGEGRQASKEQILRAQTALGLQEDYSDERRYRCRLWSLVQGERAFFYGNALQDPLIVADEIQPEDKDGSKAAKGEQGDKKLRKGKITRIPAPLDALTSPPLAALRLRIEEEEPQKGWRTRLDKTIAAEFTLRSGTQIVWVLPDDAPLQLEGDGEQPSLDKVRTVLPLFNIDLSLTKNEHLRYWLWEARQGQPVSVWGKLVQERPVAIAAAGREKLVISLQDESVQRDEIKRRLNKSLLWLMWGAILSFMVSCLGLILLAWNLLIASG
jgi:dienelactone hydrolase